MNKNKFLILFILCCALPLVAAKVILELGWFTAGSSSQGKWLQQEIFLLEDASKQQNHWRIAVVAERCEQLRCQQALHTVQQLYVGLGRKQNQVQTVFVGQALPAEYSLFHLHQSPAASQLQNQIVIVDQHGLALLSYPMPEQAEQMAVTAKAIRADLMKLINYDRTSV